jgi:hypothetical protein
MHVFARDGFANTFAVELEKQSDLLDQRNRLACCFFAAQRVGSPPQGRIEADWSLLSHQLK